MEKIKLPKVGDIVYIDDEHVVFYEQPHFLSFREFVKAEVSLVIKKKRVGSILWASLLSTATGRPHKLGWVCLSVQNWSLEAMHE